MNEMRCEIVQERLPDLANGRLPEDEAGLMRAHVGTCSDCAESLELLTLLDSGRPETPPGLATRIETSVLAVSKRGLTSPVTRPWWGVAAAAVAALALGIGVSSGPGTSIEVPAYVAEAQSVSPWLSDDGVIAGAPTLDGLSDEALLTLLDEMGDSPSGGAA